MKETPYFIHPGELRHACAGRTQTALQECHNNVGAKLLNNREVFVDGHLQTVEVGMAVWVAAFQTWRLARVVKINRATLSVDFIQNSGGKIGTRTVNPAQTGTLNNVYLAVRYTNTKGN